MTSENPKNDLLEHHPEGQAMKQKGLELIGETIVDILDSVTHMSEYADAMIGLPTGFADIDAMTAGLQNGDLIVIASRPGMGKSALACNIAEHAALREGTPVAIFSMELSSAQFSQRLLASNGRVALSHLETGRLTDDEWPQLTDAIKALRLAPIAITDTPDLDCAALRPMALQAKGFFGALSLLVVDGLHMMKGSALENLHGLKALARELDCPVVLTSQIGDGTDFRVDKRPTLADIRQIEGLEYVPDALVFLYRDEVYTKEACREPGVAEVIFAKQRTGPVGMVKLAFIPQITKFQTLEGAV